MYLPIPEGVNHTASVTAYLAATDCEAAKSLTRSATFSIAKSLDSQAREIQSNSALSVIDRPTAGVWAEIKKSGRIAMTPMEIISESTTNQLGRLRVPYIATQPCVIFQDKGRVNGSCVHCKIDRFDFKCAVARGSYVEQGDLSYWKSKYPKVPHYVLNKGYLDENKIAAAKTSVYAELFQAYNLGEEIAELRETITSITGLISNAVKIILDSKKVISSLLKKGKVGLAGDKWMEFRYGLMPIIYSIQDILDLKRDSGKYRTTRATVFPEIEVEEIGDRPNVYFEEVGSHSIIAHLTAKARWTTDEIKKFDLINVNPLTTFTAVLPWSMVVRWFFNVQSYLDCRVKSLTSLALEHNACVAVREKSEYGTYLSAKIGYNASQIWYGGNPYCGTTYHGTHVLGPWVDYDRQNVLLQLHHVNNYKRYLFQPSDVELVFSPHMTWQRAIDGMVLGLGSVSKLLRRLK